MGFFSKKKNKSTAAPAAPAPTAAPAPVAQSDDDEIVAAITAALSAFLGGGSGNLVIRPLSRSGEIWITAGRMQNLH